MKILEKYFIKDISNIINKYFYNFEKEKENVIRDLKLIFKFFGENNIGSPHKGETDIYEDIREYVGADIIFKRVPMVFMYITPSDFYWFGSGKSYLLTNKYVPEGTFF